MNKAQKKRKINMRNFDSDLSAIFKNRFDKLGYSKWEELTEKLGLENKRTFIDFFNGKQCITQKTLEEAFNILDIPCELIDIYCEKVTRYKIKKVRRVS